MLQIVDGGCFFAEGLLILPFHFISIVYFSFFGLNTLLKIKEKFVKFSQQQNIAKLIHSQNSRILYYKKNSWNSKSLWKWNYTFNAITNSWAWFEVSLGSIFLAKHSDSSIKIHCFNCSIRSFNFLTFSWTPLSSTCFEVKYFCLFSR